MIKITVPIAQGLLARAVLTQGPDFIYNPPVNAGERTKNCRNSPNPDAPEDHPMRITGCLVGTALTLHGLTAHTNEYNNNGNVLDFQSRHPEALTEQAAYYFFAAQATQDGGESWGAAYAGAEEQAASLATAERMIAEQLAAGQETKEDTEK